MDVMAEIQKEIDRLRLLVVSIGNGTRKNVLTLIDRLEHELKHIEKRRAEL